MQHSEFITKLRRLNPRLVFRPGRNIASGLYEAQCGPDSTIGLKHLCGIPSPRYFFNIPKFNFVDDTGQWHRGWKTVLRILTDKGLINRYDVMRGFGTSVYCGPNGESLKQPGRKLTVQEKFDERVSHFTLADKRKLYASAAL
jgi:hypothetical protein